MVITNFRLPYIQIVVIASNNERQQRAAHKGIKRTVRDQRTSANSLKEPVIKSSAQALQIAEQLTDFAGYRGLEELSSALLNRLTTF